MGSTVDKLNCVKCGSGKGWSGPKYKRWVGYPIREFLVFTCAACGYERAENTKDYVQPLPDPMPIFIPQRCGWWFWSGR